VLQRRLDTVATCHLHSRNLSVARSYRLGLCVAVKPCGLVALDKGLEWSIELHLDYGDVEVGRFCGHPAQHLASVVLLAKAQFLSRGKQARGFHFRGDQGQRHFLAGPIEDVQIPGIAVHGPKGEGRAKGGRALAPTDGFAVDTRSHIIQCGMRTDNLPVYRNYYHTFESCYEI